MPTFRPKRDLTTITAEQFDGTHTHAQRLGLLAHEGHGATLWRLPLPGTEDSVPVAVGDWVIVAGAPPARLSNVDFLQRYESTLLPVI